MSGRAYQPIEKIQRELWELLACGQSLAESQHWLAGEHLVLYQPSEILDSDSNLKFDVREYRMIESLLNPMLLSAAKQPDVKYFAAGALILDGSHGTEGLRHKVTALLAMNDCGNFIEREAASFGVKMFNAIEKVIVDRKKKSEWNSSSQEKLTLTCIKTLLEHCKPKIRFLLKKKKEICRAIWLHLHTFLEESGQRPIDARLNAEIIKFFALFESSDENEWDTSKCCTRANAIRIIYAKELAYVDSVFQSLYSDLRSLRNGKAETTRLSPEQLRLANQLETVLAGECKAAYAEPVLSSLAGGEEVDLTADDAKTPFALLRLLCKLGQYPSAVHRMVDTFSRFHTGYTLNIETVSGPWFPQVAYNSESLQLPDRETETAFRRFLEEKVFFYYGEPSLVKALAPKYYTKLKTQYKPYIHGEVKLACILLARGIAPVNSKISGTKLCCFTCDKFLKLFQKHFNFNIFVAGTHSKVYCQWLFPDMALVWKHLDQESTDGFYRKLGLSVEQEKQRRRAIDKKMQALATDLHTKVRSKVKEIASVVLRSRTILSESQPSYLEPDVNEATYDREGLSNDDEDFNSYMRSTSPDH